MTFSEIERVLTHCPHLMNFWLFLRVGEFCLFVLLTSRFSILFRDIISKKSNENFSSLQNPQFVSKAFVRTLLWRWHVPDS